MTHQEKTSRIRREINEVYGQIKKAYPIFNYQNTLGLIIFLVSISAILLASFFWYKGELSTWLMIIINAFFMGVLHEIEHDLIHWLYFKGNKVVHHFMLFVVWMLRPLTVNPWIRRTLHLHHHKFSGTMHDVEERSVTNGEKWSLKRLLTTADVVLGGIMRLSVMFRDIDHEVTAGRLKVETSSRLKRIMLLSIVPITIIAHLILYVFLGDLILDFFHRTFNTNIVLPVFLKDILDGLTIIIYTILIPNLVRQFSLHFITSNLHYFGDVEDGNVLEQTQVLTVWWTLPFQVFCFFFGWTHSIHHFVVNETFFLRHFGRKRAQNILKKYGVRFNDLGTFKRANRYHSHD